MAGCCWVARLEDWEVGGEWGGVWENAFLLSKGGWEWQTRGHGFWLYKGVIERVMDRYVEQVSIEERCLGEYVYEGFTVGLASVILGRLERPSSHATLPTFHCPAPPSCQICLCDGCG